MKKIKLNLGSGKDYIDGWVNVDIEEQYNPDVIADVTWPLPFNDASASEIKAFDILEHVTKQQAPVFIKECHRVLKIGGKLHLRLPNMFSIIDKYKEDPEVMAHFLYGDTSETGVYGAHKAGYIEKSLRRLLTLQGFSSITIEQEDTNYVVEAVKKATSFKEKLTIGIVQQSADYGGAEVYMIRLMEQWTKAGHMLHVATTPGLFEKSSRKIASTVQSHTSIVDIIGDWKGFVKTFCILPFTYFTYLKILTSFRKNKVDILVMSEFSERLILAPLARAMGFQIVWIEYGRPHNTFQRMFPWSKMLFRLVKDLPARIITPTQYVQQSLMIDGRVSLSKIDIIPCGTAVSHLKPHARHTVPVIGCISRLAREKGQADLLRAMQLVLNHHDAELWIIGKGPDEKYLKELAVKLGIADKVQFKGFVKNISEIYSQTDVAVFPSTWELEGFGLVLIEAMASGVPVVASSIGPVPEVVGDAALRYAPGDVDGLSNQLSALINDTRLQASLKVKGLKRVEELYSIESSAHKMIESFRTALCD
ncbi:glycosyltransferase [Candidatus Woesebacteria bacterium]|nr:glycosyltransferase [Candidatus Woesebacteria bacterium]